MQNVFAKKHNTETLITVNQSEMWVLVLNQSMLLFQNSAEQQLWKNEGKKRKEK